MGVVNSANGTMWEITPEETVHPPLHKLAKGGGRGNQACWRKGMRLALSLTFLQFVFAVYATFLLYFMSPSLDLRSLEKPLHFPAISQSSSWFTTTHLFTAFFSTGGQDLCEAEEITFEQKKSGDMKQVKMKNDFFKEIMDFQQHTRGCETLAELMKMPTAPKAKEAKVTVILNHFKRKTLCAQINAFLQQSLPFHRLWVLAFGSPKEDTLRSIVNSFNDSRISFVGSNYDFKYYGRFQLALQPDDADYVYIVDDDMIPGKKVLEIFVHAAGTRKYNNSVLGSIGRILPFRQKDFSFPSYRKSGAREAGLYVPDPAYGIVVDRVFQVDFLSSGWFLPSSLVKTLFLEDPFTFATGEDLHLSYQLQKYKGAHSYVLPVDPKNKDTWADSEHRLAYVAETTVIFKGVVEQRDRQWWEYMSRGYVTQWARMNPQQIDVLFYAHTVGEIGDLAPLINRFRGTPGKKAYVVVTGEPSCSCEKASAKLGWPPTGCGDRRFKIFDLGIGGEAHILKESMAHQIQASIKGLLEIHHPLAILTLSSIDPAVAQVLNSALSKHSETILIQLPRQSIPHALWMADIKPAALLQWNKMKVSINIVTQNRPRSLRRLLDSIEKAYYVGDEILLTFNMDSAVDGETLKMVNGFNWPYGQKVTRRRIIQGGLIRAVSESWYPSSDDDYGLLLEDDIEVSPFYYMWIKYGLMKYRYDPDAVLPELNAIALYTPRLVEVVKERPKWNATDFFKGIHPNTPYLHQLPCSWGALFFPQKWREFYKYMNMRYTENAKENPVQIPKSRTNGWQASWKKYMIDLMYLRGYVTLYPNFPHQTSFSTNHMEPGAHIAASDNKLSHNKADFVVPLMKENFCNLLPLHKMPPASKLPVINLFNQASTLKSLKAAGAKLKQDVLQCNLTHVVRAHSITGEPLHCGAF